MLDQSFPRTEEELNEAVDTLSALQEWMERDDAHILLTSVLEGFVEHFEWSQTTTIPLLMEVYRLLQQWILSPNERIIRLRLEHVQLTVAHPLPSRCTSESLLVGYWADELGKVLSLHDQTGVFGYFIGIACPGGFSGGIVDCYALPPNRAFPIVGPAQVGSLEDAYEWVLPDGIHRREVSFKLAHKNVYTIGASEVKSPSGGGSHYIVKFDGKRSWTLDRNDDPLPPAFLNQLVDIAGYPLDVIRYALTEGRLPRRLLRLRVST
ncbi:hypothetical protein KEG38_52600 [Polyangium jinanense]|uniref:hypothetical protein n=1 Tax=Polyangium jinanense TaxID=2829994 RepID=UPI00234193D8|nr:hypothetical protein [Polyangium jinanense]MDC3962566.1 hypothetical protein [Polyangium jinanense]